MSFGRRAALMQRVRELARRIKFLEASETAADRMDAGLLRAEIDRVYLLWGLKSISGLWLDGAEASPEGLIDSGPEDICREALEVVRAETGLSEAERKN
jgi:hypothetical protein